MTTGLLLKKELIEMHPAVSDRESVIRKLGNDALKLGLIKEAFIERVLSRETEYPTGLPTAIPVAIPHVDGDCIEPFMSVAVLDKKIPFYIMGQTEESVDVNLVFLFGITDPKAQVEVLQGFINAFNDPDNTRRIIEAGDKEDVIAVMKSLLGDGVCL